MAINVPLLEVRQLSRTSRDGSTLLEEINLKIEAGERWVIAGASGSGKTLLLRSLAMLDPAEGELEWSGEPVGAHNITEYRSCVIYLAQSAAIIDGDVRENLRLPLSLTMHRDLKWPEKEVTDWCHRFGKESDFLNRDAHDVSGGEKQIVALIRALMIRPQILLLDEATSALDPKSVKVYEQIVEEWLQEDLNHRATIWVSHSEDQRGRVSDHEVNLSAGKIAGSDT